MNSSPNDCYLLRRPINNSLWLVGDYCYHQHIGSAHGAFKTGKWAAEKIIKNKS